jgi:hypothetical protein
MKSNFRLSLFSSIAALALGLASAPMASAIPITPTGTSFGLLSAATFGGSGIPKTDVEIFANGTITLGLTATQRYANPALTNDLAGTFRAVSGGDTLNSAPTLARWNFDLYISGLGSSEYVKFFYDNNAAVGNDVPNFYTIPGDYQNSLNLGFASFNGGIFNPSAAGEYGFALVAYDSNNVEIGRSAIQVEVGSVPDGGSTAVMLGGALMVGFYFRRRTAAK